MAAQVSYQNEVMAVLAKAGCNMGTCHGNANGKGGFKISLRGESPAEDWKMIARNELGRRLNLIEPDESLLLKKATAQIPHEGRRRFEVDSWEYRILRQWIAEGAKNDAGQASKLTALEVARFTRRTTKFKSRPRPASPTAANATSRRKRSTSRPTICSKSLRLAK